MLFRSSPTWAKQILSIPKSEIKKITELKSELEFHLDNSEIVFSTSSNISQFIDSKASEEICIVDGVNCINPRSKLTLIFFKDYFVSKGSSYDHSISYNDVEEMFFLKRCQEHFLMLRLVNPVVQGQTTYDSLVFLLGDKELDVASTDPRLKSFYQDGRSEAFLLLNILESLLKIKAQESVSAVKCTSKVFEGYLYLLHSSLQFLPKPISIPLSEISYVEFSRINLSMAQAKTFDMAVYASKVHIFSGIAKDAFNELEVFLNENSIRIVSEVIEEYVSEESDDTESGSDLSDLVESED